MTIATEATLREIIGGAHPITLDKEMDRLDKHARHFITLSPFLCLETTNGDGQADVSPRGDPAGFVKVLDDRTLLIPEQPGNRRADSMLNVMTESVVGLIFFVPGIEETMRISGRATVVDDTDQLADLAVNGKVPKLAIRVEVARVFFHCAKALKRSRLWDPDSRVGRDAFPTPGQVIRDHRRPDDSAERLDALVIEDQETNLYWGGAGPLFYHLRHLFECWKPGGTHDRRRPFQRWLSLSHQRYGCSRRADIPHRRASYRCGVSSAGAEPHDVAMQFISTMCNLA